MVLQQFRLPFIIITVLIQSIRSKFCYGVATCASLNISQADLQSWDTGMDCYGDQSCAHSYISGMDYIDALGAYSLFNSIVDSVNIDQGITLSGYHAGLGAKIICRHTHTCSVWCSANACFNLSLQCDGTCEVDMDSADSIAPIYVQQIDVIFPDPVNHGFNLLHDAYALSLGYNVSALVCEEHASCVCRELILNYNGAIFCSGAASCKLWSLCSEITPVINTTKSLYCGGEISCHDSQLYNAERFICSGLMSCSGDTIIFTSGLGKTHFIYLIGDSAGERATIHCLENDTCHILCGGYRACDRTQLICTGTCIVECDKDSYCPYDSVSQRYFYPTSAPTMEPTIDPTINPTTEPSAPTVEPTTDPTTEPTADPTADPIMNPTVDPTVVPTVDPTVDPTGDPTAFMNSISLQYTAYIVLEQHDIDEQEAIDIERRILIAFHNTSVRVLSTDVMRNGFVSFDIIIATHHDLDSEDVSELLERELKDDLGDVHVSVVKDDDEPPSNTKAKDIYYWLYNDVATSILYGVVTLTLTCAICCYLQQRQKSKLLNHHIMELTVAMEAMQNDRDDDAERGEKERVSSISLVEMKEEQEEEEEEEATIEGSDDQYEDEGNENENADDEAINNPLVTSGITKSDAPEKAAKSASESIASNDELWQQYPQQKTTTGTADSTLTEAGTGGADDV